MTAVKLLILAEGKLWSEDEQASKAKTILIYDKRRQLIAKYGPATYAFRSQESLTRIEVQLRGDGVPFKKFSAIHRYGEIDLLATVRFGTLNWLPPKCRGIRFLAAYGLRQLIHRFGQQAAAKRLGPQLWAYIAKNHLQPVPSTAIQGIRPRLKRSVENWLCNRLRYPRT
jgi:hypothetical protein